MHKHLVAVLAISGALLSAEVLNGPVPVTLSRSSEKVLDVPAFSFFLPARSDAKGNLFIHPAPFQEVNILKITPSSETTVYRMPDAQKYTFYEYSVAPEGVVWALINEVGSPELLATQFSSDGTPKTPFRLEVPNDVNATHFIALDSGALFLAGNYTGKVRQKMSGRQFLGVFDGSGTLLRDLGDKLPSSAPAKISGEALQEGNCTSAEDNNAYFLGGDSIVVVTPGGSISKRVHFAKPAPNLFAQGLNVSHGWAAITLSHYGSDKLVQNSYLVIQLETGKVMGWYKPEDGMGAELAFSPDEGFTFFSNDKGKLKLVQAKLR